MSEEVDEDRRSFLKGLGGLAAGSQIGGKMPTGSSEEKTLSNVMSVHFDHDKDSFYISIDPEKNEQKISELAAEIANNSPPADSYEIPLSRREYLDGGLESFTNPDPFANTGIGKTPKEKLEKYDSALEKLEKTGEEPQDIDIGVDINDETGDDRLHVCLESDVETGAFYSWLHGNEMDVWAKSGKAYIEFNGSEDEFSDYMDTVRSFRSADFTPEEAYAVLDHDTATVYAAVDEVLW